MYLWRSRGNISSATFRLIGISFPEPVSSILSQRPSPPLPSQPSPVSKLLRQQAGGPGRDLQIAPADLLTASLAASLRRDAKAAITAAAGGATPPVRDSDGAETDR